VFTDQVHQADHGQVAHKDFAGGNFDRASGNTSSIDPQAQPACDLDCGF